MCQWGHRERRCLQQNAPTAVHETYSLSQHRFPVLKLLNFFIAPSISSVNFSLVLSLCFAIGGRSFLLREKHRTVVPKLKWLLLAMGKVSSLQGVFQIICWDNSILVNKLTLLVLGTATNNIVHNATREG